MIRDVPFCGLVKTNLKMRPLYAKERPIAIE